MMFADELFSKNVVVALLYFMLLYCEVTANVIEGIDDQTVINVDLVSTSQPLQENISQATIDVMSHVASVDSLKTPYPREGITSNVLETTEVATAESEKINMGITSTFHSTTISELSKKESAPEQTFVVYNSKGRICLLAKFLVIISIYKSGEEVSFNMPDNAISRGKCGDDIESPLLRLSWDEFELIIMFSKVSTEGELDHWAVTSLDLRYDTSAPFLGGINLGTITARSKNIKIFKTEMGKSFSCPATETISLYSSNKKVATIRMKDVELQPFDVNGGNFSTIQRCSHVATGGPEESFYQDETDETVPLAVGLTFTVITLIAIVGFSVYRAYTMRKVDYNSME